MSYAASTSPTHLNPRSPFVFDIRTLGRRPGSSRSEERRVPAPADLHVALARVPAGAEVTLDVTLDAMSDGVLVTASATVPVSGECARCLEPLSTTAEVSFRELYEAEASPADEADDDYEDRRFLDGDLLDLEPALRDAVVLALPLAPLCQEDCEGLCPDCGVRLAEVDAGHGHGDVIDPRWAQLGQLDVRDNEDGARAADQQEN